MSVSNFYTVSVNSPAAAASAGGHTALGGSMLPGQNFVDFILAMLAEKAEGAAAVTTEADEPLQSGNPLLSKEPKLDISTLIAANPEISEEVAQMPIGEQEQLIQTLNLNQKAFDEILKPLLGEDGTITIEDLQAQSDENLKVLDALFVGDGKSGEFSLDRLKAILAKLEELTEQGSPVYIATNLTPEQIARLQDILKGQSEEELDEKAFAGVFIGLVQIVPPVAKTAQASVSAIPQDVAEAEAAKASDALAAELNAIVPGGEGDEEASLEGESEFGAAMKSASKKAAASIGAEKSMEAKASADGSVLHTSSPVAGSLFTTPEWATDFMEKMGAHIQNGLSAMGIGHATNVSVQAGGATMPHPATQMVAATIQKAATDGEARNIILQLDPPELGRVEIRMSFEKDKSIKAVMIAEKPETMAMLQRDAHVLERALTASGLEADGGLSFQLAQDGYDFNHNGRHDGYGGHGNGGGNEDADIDAIIETTMNWYVDPETGHMRYNLMA